MSRPTHPKQLLGFFPTPLYELSRLSNHLGGARLFIKRDDMTGLALGGNKTRKLEYILGDAIAKGANAIITAGAAQSNHCRQTAAAAALLNMECHLLLGGQRPPAPEGNLLLNTLFDAYIHWTGKHRKGENIPAVYDQLTRAGKRPYVVPYGGSNALGALGYVGAMHELAEQTARQPVPPTFTHIVFASSSGATQAGMLVGKQKLDEQYQLVGINIDKTADNETPLEQHICGMANSTAAILDMQTRFNESDVILNQNYLGGGYGVVGSIERDAINALARLEGILLDPVYTGRAMGGLMDMIRNGEISTDSQVLFWHTGGTPALFAHAEDLSH